MHQSLGRSFYQACIYLLHDMGWLRLVGSLKLQVSFAEYRLFYRALLQKRPVIWRSLLIEATPYGELIYIIWLVLRHVDCILIVCVCVCTVYTPVCTSICGRFAGCCDLIYICACIYILFWCALHLYIHINNNKEIHIYMYLLYIILMLLFSILHVSFSGCCELMYI